MVRLMLRAPLLCTTWLLLAPAAHAAITDCDRLASHPADPDKVLPGVERGAMDLARAEEACRAAVAADPRSARAHYQLGRVLFYARKTPEALRALERAVEIGYRQAIFVLGYVYSEGTQVPRDECRAAALWERSVGLEHPWTGYYLVERHLDGRFRSCRLALADADLRRWLDLARERISVAASDGRIEQLAARLARHLQAPGASAP